MTVGLFNASYSLLILMMLFASVMRKKEKRTKQTKLYLLMLVFLMVLEINTFAMDFCTARQLTGTMGIHLFLLFVMDPPVLLLWMLYCTVWIDEDWKKLQPLMVPVISALQ